MTTLLVIGGSGFFGKSILDAYGRGLLAPWNIERIFVLARQASLLQAQHPELMHPGVELIDADITTCLKLPAADFVIHAAASTDARKYLAASQTEKANILMASAHFCTLARQYLQNSKIVYASSGAVYGQQPSTLEKIPETYTLQCSVDQMVETKRDYAAAKRDAELMMTSLAAEGLHLAIARCFAFVGQYLPRDQHFAIGNFIGCALEGRPIEVRATSPVIRSYMYADDLVVWLMTIAEHANCVCPIYNVGSDEPIGILELAQTIAKRSGLAVLHGPQESQPVDRYVPAIDVARAQGMKLQYDLSRALDVTFHGIQTVSNPSRG
jgi:nucleoside-diphosphate-sugar epimerase